MKGVFCSDAGKDFPFATFYGGGTAFAMER